MRFNSTTVMAVFAAFMAFTMLPVDALASTTTGLPWEDPLDTIMSSLTGPVALICSIIGMAVAGLSLVFAGGEVSEFVRRVIMLVLVISLIVGAASGITVLFGTSSAVIASPEALELLKNG
ncbi:TrbC/VirB2 family protein [Microbulbifer aggregans]|uniref:TrbC/VirB2 family protein n=1 Tax=Microbulbifer aggregans TaxID=1769779 RepID=UPI001CFD7E33|nr:TrbC/VirB2 family protein [Microbulbifer aggregans]